MSSQAQAARSLISAGRPREAISILLQGLSSSPQDHDLHCLLAQAHLGIDQPQEALRAATQAAALAPGEEWPHRLRSIALRKLGRKNESIDAARESVRLDPALAFGRRNLAEAYLAANRVDQAYGDALEAVRLMPDSADSFDVLGRCLIQKKQYREAEANFRRALELDPNNAVAHNNLGVSLRNQGRSVEALNAFNAAAKIDPSFETARNNLYSGTRRLLGGGSLAFIFVLLIRFAVVVNAGRRSPVLAMFAGAVLLLGIVLFIRRYRPFRRQPLPATAVAYYRAETRRKWIANRPFILLRLASLPVAGAMVALALALHSGLVLLFTYPLIAAWYLLSPWLWRRFVQRAG